MTTPHTTMDVHSSRVAALRAELAELQDIAAAYELGAHSGQVSSGKALARAADYWEQAQATAQALSAAQVTP